MKKILFGLSLIACAAVASAADETVYPVCVSFAPAGYCDAMEFDAHHNATWHNYDCAGSQGLQTLANYGNPFATTKCTASSGCNPAVVDGWTWFKWKFNRTASTGTLKGKTGGQVVVLQQDIPVAITTGACSVNRVQGGVSSLSR